MMHHACYVKMSWNQNQEASSLPIGSYIQSLSSCNNANIYYKDYSIYVHRIFFWEGGRGGGELVVPKDQNSTKLFSNCTKLKINLVWKEVYFSPWGYGSNVHECCQRTSNATKKKSFMNMIRVNYISLKFKVSSIFNFKNFGFDP